jgi:hypothetical protein
MEHAHLSRYICHYTCTAPGPPYFNQQNKNGQKMREITAQPEHVHLEMFLSPTTNVRLPAIVTRRQKKFQIFRSN